MTTGLKNSPLILDYQALITSKKIAEDKAQEKVIFKLAELKQNFERYYRKHKKLLNRIFCRAALHKSKGLYIYGGVGRGKSMLMDLFLKDIDEEIPASRSHFHAFMSDVHTKIKEWHDKNLEEKHPDVIKFVAEEIAKTTALLCFDEMQINDIADAMIIGRLFEALMEHNIVIVATSNRHPDELYKDGLQRDRFLPFIEMFKAKMDIIELKSDIDYRMLHIEKLSQTYFTPLGVGSSVFIEKAYNELTSGGSSKPRDIEVRGRKIHALKSSGDVGFFSFKELCDANLGSEDYIEIARRFNTILINGIPKMRRDDYNLAIRFTKLIDQLYEHKCKLIATAEVPANELYIEGEQSFEFARTVSRLMEMQSKDYLRAEHRG